MKLGEEQVMQEINPEVEYLFYRYHAFTSIKQDSTGPDDKSLLILMLNAFCNQLTLLTPEDQKKKIAKFLNKVPSKPEDVYRDLAYSPLLSEIKDLDKKHAYVLLMADKLKMCWKNNNELLKELANAISYRLVIIEVDHNEKRIKVNVENPDKRIEAHIFIGTRPYLLYTKAQFEKYYPKFSLSLDKRKLLDNYKEFLPKIIVERYVEGNVLTPEFYKAFNPEFYKLEKDPDNRRLCKDVKILTETLYKKLMEIQEDYKELGNIIQPEDKDEETKKNIKIEEQDSDIKLKKEEIKKVIKDLIKRLKSASDKTYTPKALKELYEEYIKYFEDCDNSDSGSEDLAKHVTAATLTPGENTVREVQVSAIKPLQEEEIEKPTSTCSICENEEEEEEDLRLLIPECNHSIHRMCLKGQFLLMDQQQPYLKYCQKKY
eukprot:TRINITY_DN280_c1_g1_i1.p1 TRINITY_DN280_c1_g1~~TRINITY_DN280_c1_g1_i1.p1  ORF type:complete len:431 (+),score=74.24 TRINITY_DN280_c1_g1_i1:1166-2458(+)